MAERGTIERDVYYGDDEKWDLTFTTTDSNGNTVPRDLTVYDNVVMEAKRAFDADPIVTWELGNGIQVVGTDDNILRVDLTWDFTADLTPGRDYVYDIRFRQSQDVTTLIDGTLRAEESISQRP